MWLNEDGSEQAIEHAEIPSGPDDKRSAGLKRWLWRVVGNGSSEVSFDTIHSGLHPLLPEGAWLRDVFDRYAVWTDQAGRLWKQDYSVSSSGSVAFAGTAQEVRREVTYEPVINAQEKDNVKELIINALRAAGVSTDGKSDDQLLKDFEAMKVQPHIAATNEAHNKVATFEAAARAAEEAEVSALAADLATNSALTVDDLKKLGSARLRELKAKAAPVRPGAAEKGAADEFAGYSINSLIDAK
jgi:hypothetical protein